MTLAAQSKIISLLLLILVSITAFVYFELIESVAKERKSYDHLSEISRGVFELSLLTSEHLALRTERSEVQWKRRHASLTNHMLVASRTFEDESVKQLLRARVALAALRKLFFKIVIAEHKLVNATDIERKKYEKLISTLAIQVRLTSQQLVSDISRVGFHSLESLKQAEKQASYILGSVLSVILVVLIIVMIWLQKFFISPIIELSRFSEKLIEGDYKKRIQVNSDNEIGYLANSFNALASTVAEKIEDLVKQSDKLEKSNKQLEASLEKTQTTERQYKDIFTAAADSIFTIDDKGIILTANPASTVLFGYKIEELIGENIKIIVSPEHYDNHDSYIKNYIKTKIKKVIGHEVQVEGKHKDGTLIPINLRIAEIHRDKKNEFIGVLRDIREELTAKEEAAKANELLEVTNKELESYAYSISHDLRSPLRSIDGFSLVLLEDYSETLDDEAKDYLNRIRAGSKKMSELITELLNISRIMKEAMKLEKIDMSALAHEELKPIVENYPDNNIEFICEKDMIVLADRPLLQSIVENLLNNAVKYSHRNKHIKIEMGSFVDKNKTIYYVKDNGAGFDMKHINKLFKPFQRLHKVNQFEGSGIGLATVQRIISRHNGKIWAEAEIDKGATFFFTLS